MQEVKELMERVEEPEGRESKETLDIPAELGRRKKAARQGACSTEPRARCEGAGQLRRAGERDHESGQRQTF